MIDPVKEDRKYIRLLAQQNIFILLRKCIPAIDDQFH